MKETIAEKLLEFLSKNRHPYCDDCLAEHCHIKSRSQVYTTCTYVIPAKLSRGQEACHGCGKVKKTRRII
jgi:hypothetical protein